MSVGIMKKIGLGLLALIAVLALLMYINPQIRPSHTEPYLALQNESEAPAPQETQIRQRIILYGDAGHSTIEPWQASMARVAQRASISPDRTAVVALGDNIYMQGYPQKEEGQQDWDEGQLESISFLDAQLKVAVESGASMYFVPGNHDWYASELNSQAAHVAEFAEENGVNTRFEPPYPNDIPLSSTVHLNGITLLFFDSEWLLRSEGEPRQEVLDHMHELMADSRRLHPDNVILLNSHHPIETMGQHAGYLAEFNYWLFINIIFTLFPQAAEEDTCHPLYQRMIADLYEVMGKHDRVLYAAGHEHSLQVYRDANEKGQGPEYSLVSGAGNSNKVSGVWHNENTRFALSQEGFMELNITDQGVYLQVFDIHHEESRGGFWLDI